MYINPKILDASGIDLHLFGLLCLIAANRQTDNSEAIEGWSTQEQLQQTFEKGLTELVAAKNKKDTIYRRIRLTKRGRELIEDITTPEVSDPDLAMRDYLIDIYLSHEDKDRVIGNKKLIGIYCAQLRNHLNLTLHEFFYLCELFLAEYSWTKKLENIFFNKRDNPYGRFKDNVESSPLYQYYETNKDRVEDYWKTKIK